MAKLQITPAIAIDEDDLVESFVLASGPGGQNVNKVATAVELRVDIAGLPDGVRMRLAHLAGLRNLESLELTGVKFTGEGLRWLSGLTELRTLRLVNTAVTDESLGHLAPLKDLRDLNL